MFFFTRRFFTPLLHGSKLKKLTTRYDRVSQ